VKKLTLFNPSPSNPPPPINASQGVVPLIVPSAMSSTSPYSTLLPSSGCPIDILAKYPELVNELPAIEESFCFLDYFYINSTNQSRPQTVPLYTASMRPLVCKPYHFLRNVFDSGARYGDPATQEPVLSGATLAGKAINAMVDVLWSGWENDCCSKKQAYHLIFPANITTEEKAVFMGSTFLVDVTRFEQEQ